MNVIVGFDHEDNKFFVWHFAKSTDIDNLPVVSGNPEVIDGGLNATTFTDVLNKSIQGYSRRASLPSPMIENKTDARGSTQDVRSSSSLDLAKVTLAFVT